MQILCEQEDDQERRRFLERLRALLPESEQSVLELMLEGVRENEAYAAAMGITHLPTRQQRKQVKRVKDRINKRARRLREKP